MSELVIVVESCWDGIGYHAYDVNSYDGAPDSDYNNIGFGMTKIEAELDLLEQLEEG